MESKGALLSGRGILRVSGQDARSFLQGLITNDVETLKPGEGRFAALLSPQGKILFDFFVAPDGDALLMDCNGAQTADLAKRLGFYKLRADVRVSDESAALSVAAFGDAPAQALAFRDPRHAGMGWRVIGTPDELDRLGVIAGLDDTYAALRISLGVPEGGVDFVYGETFPHEANMDLVHGVDFRKGCYIGQEVVSRVEHRGTARKRIVRMGFTGPAPAYGTEILAGDLVIGHMGSSAEKEGLALVRIDRIAEAEGAITAGDSALTCIDGRG